MYKHFLLWTAVKVALQKARKCTDQLQYLRPGAPYQLVMETPNNASKKLLGTKSTVCSCETLPALTTAKVSSFTYGPAINILHRTVLMQSGPESEFREP